MSNRDYNRACYTIGPANVASNVSAFVVHGNMLGFRGRVVEAYIQASAALTATAGNYQTITVAKLTAASAATTIGVITGQTTASGGHGSLVAGTQKRVDNLTTSTTWGTSTGAAVTIAATDSIRATFAKTGNGKAYTQVKLHLIVEPFADN